MIRQYRRSHAQGIPLSRLLRDLEDHWQEHRNPGTLKATWTAMSECLVGRIADDFQVAQRFEQLIQEAFACHPDRFRGLPVREYLDALAGEWRYNHHRGLLGMRFLELWEMVPGRPADQEKLTQMYWELLGERRPTRVEKVHSGQPIRPSIGLETAASMLRLRGLW